jgi:hypothetical protein
MMLEMAGRDPETLYEWERARGTVRGKVNTGETNLNF